MRRVIVWLWGLTVLLWAATAYAMSRAANDAVVIELESIPVASLGLAVMLALIGGTASTFQRLASSDPLVRSVSVEVGSVITASIVAGLAAFFFCMWRGWPAPLTALVITLSSWGGKRVLDQALDAWVRKIQGEKV